MSFGVELRRAREESGLSQQSLASKVRYSNSYLSRIEKGDRPPPKGLPRKLDQLFGTGTLFQDPAKPITVCNEEEPSLGLPLTIFSGSDGRINFVPPSRRSLKRVRSRLPRLFSPQGMRSEGYLQKSATASLPRYSNSPFDRSLIKIM
jgi:transcriptional regulator with XRE-family HTH domain